MVKLRFVVQGSGNCHYHNLLKTEKQREKLPLRWNLLQPSEKERLRPLFEQLRAS